MPFYTGRTADGSDMVEASAFVYTNPDNEDEWSSHPYPAQRKASRNYSSVIEYMSGKYTLRDVYLQIQAKTCKLPSSLRQYVLSHYDSNGVFIEN